VGGVARDADDATLARAVAEGQMRALGLVWDRYAALVRGILRRALGPGADVDDQVQVIFVAFFRDVKKIRDPGALRSFLIGIATRVARAELRRRRFRHWFMLTKDGVVPEEACPGGDDDAREAVARLYAVLDRLDESSRMIFVLRYIEGLELTETAAAMDVSLATAKRHLARVTARVHAMAARDPILAGYLDSKGGPDHGGDET
jgi:RNA polymerase sigma-70 factor (ECF subfamily)